MTTIEIERKMKSMRTMELDEHRSNLEHYIRDASVPVKDRDRARVELRIAEQVLDEREVAETMRNLFRFNFGG
jgi:hypothetical protein